MIQDCNHKLQCHRNVRRIPYLECPGSQFQKGFNHYPNTSPFQQQRDLNKRLTKQRNHSMCVHAVLA